MRSRFAWWSALIWLGSAAVASPQTAPRQVLLLYSYEREFAPHQAFVQQFRPELSRAAPEPLEFIEISLQAARVSGRAPDDALAGRVQTMLGARPPDLVVSIGGPAAVFAQRNRGQLFPGAPMLLAAVDRRFVQLAAAAVNDTAVTVDHEPSRLVENILSLLPDTKHVFVVIGASHLEQVWVGELQQALRPFHERLTFSWAHELSFAEMLTRAGALPPHSAILYALLSLDATGVPLVEDRALVELHAAANAPIFGPHSTQLGKGIVGGPLVSVEEMSRTTTNVALRLLGGEPPPRIRTPTQVLAAPVFDWRELRRWNIAEDRLPRGSEVRFRDPSPWPRYRGPIMTAVLIGGFQVALVVALVFTLKRRRRTELTLRKSEGRLRLLSNLAPVMLWATDRDKVRTDVNQAWRDFTGRPLHAEVPNAWLDALHADDRARWLASFAAAFDGHEPFRIEYRLRRHDGTYRWIHDTGVPRFLADGAFAGYVGAAMDVTDLKLETVALSRLSQKLMQSHERERAWVANVLQNDLCQWMSALTVRLHGLGNAGTVRGDEVMRERIEDLSGQYADLASELFAMSDQLCSSNLQLLGLVPAGKSFCTQLAADHGVTIDVDFEGLPPGISHDISLTLFRVMQEALSNAIKHASTDRVSVSLRARHGEIQLDVTDQGVGFDPASVLHGQGLGLLGISERLGLVKGSCEIASRPGAGTRIRARVPLQ